MTDAQVAKKYPHSSIHHCPTCNKRVIIEPKQPVDSIQYCSEHDNLEYTLTTKDDLDPVKVFGHDPVCSGCSNSVKYCSCEADRRARELGEPGFISIENLRDIGNIDSTIQSGIEVTIGNDTIIGVFDSWVNAVRRHLKGEISKHDISRYAWQLCTVKCTPKEFILVGNIFDYDAIERCPK